MKVSGFFCVYPIENNINFLLTLFPSKFTTFGGRLVWPMKYLPNLNPIDVVVMRASRCTNRRTERQDETNNNNHLVSLSVNNICSLGAV